MLRPTRPMPHLGDQARIRHFGGQVEMGTVVAVLDGGRRLQVRGELGELSDFVLNAATARFLPADSAQGARLELIGEEDAAQGT